MTGQNFLLTPGGKHGQPAIVDDRLFFYAENQGVYQWATLPDGDDPLVFGRYEDTEPWELEDLRVSEHLILACLFEAIMCHAKYGASAAWLDESRLRAIVSHIPPIAIPPWRMAPEPIFRAPSRLHVHGGTRRFRRQEMVFSLDRRQNRTPAAISQAAFG